MAVLCERMFLHIQRAERLEQALLECQPPILSLLSECEWSQAIF